MRGAAHQGAERRSTRQVMPGSGYGPAATEKKGKGDEGGEICQTLEHLREGGTSRK